MWHEVIQRADETSAGLASQRHLWCSWLSSHTVTMSHCVLPGSQNVTDKQYQQ